MREELCLIAKRKFRLIKSIKLYHTQELLHKKLWSGQITVKGYWPEYDAKLIKTQLISESDSLHFLISHLTVRLGPSKMCVCVWDRSCAHASLAIIKFSGGTSTNTRGFGELVEVESKVNKQLSEVNNRALDNSLLQHQSVHRSKQLI